MAIREAPMRDALFATAVIGLGLGMVMAVVMQLMMLSVQFAEYAATYEYGYEIRHGEIELPRNP